MYGPVIQGSLVRLRPPKPEDAEPMIAWFEDLEATRFILLRFPPSINQEVEWLDRMAKSQDDVVWVIEHEGRPIGSTAIHLIDWKNGSGKTGTVIGDKALWGRGIGREVMQLRCRFAFTQLPLRKLKSAYFDGNGLAGGHRRRPATARWAATKPTTISMASGSTRSSPKCCARIG
jgi:RimJ/RimL family protein N-acetyltransferase